MPAANHAPPPLMIRRTGDAHGLGGVAPGVGPFVALKTSSMRKSPLGSRATRFAESNLVGVVVLSQKSRARTLWFPFVPIVFPPARSKPRPWTLILPSDFTSAVSAAILQIWPGGGVPRT